MENNNLEMSSIVEGTHVADTELSEAKQQMKMFLIAQAKRELSRVAKLTDTLDRLQDIYSEKVIEYVNSNPGNEIECIPVFMDTISKCLERSNDIIRRISSDDKLFNVVYADFSTNIKNEVNNISDSSSRRRVKDAVASMINVLEHSESN